MKLFVDGKPHGAKSQETVLVPAEVAVCPECRGRLWIMVTAWESGTGRMLEDGEGIECECEHESDIDEEPNHRHWLYEWLPVQSRVFRWAGRHVTVDTAWSVNSAGGGS